MRDHHEVATSQVEVHEITRQEISMYVEAGPPGSLRSVLSVVLEEGQVMQATFACEALSRAYGREVERLPILQGASITKEKVVMKLRRIGALFMKVADALQALA